MPPDRRVILPRFTDRLRLGPAGLSVSPFCLGIAGSPETVVAAYEAGINFFFLSADLHWPLYEPTRAGLRRLLDGNPARRAELVVAVVSYVDEPLFGAMQFHEVLDEVPGLGHVDVVVAGAVCHAASLNARFPALVRARAEGRHGARATGASFHDRATARAAVGLGLVDIAFSRYNASHPNARHDYFPFIEYRPGVLNYNFKSAMPAGTKSRLLELGFPPGARLPDPADHYRFVLSRTAVDGILCSPSSPAEVDELAAALARGAVSPQEEEYMILLSRMVNRAVFA